ncbi:hypothetical protein AVEN_238397-1 [Araneus ventricosus]|uniref:Uncharacterized protein n=1 Tax=Araneus ventricosus TaxID=182803 RepID=A0A4Y2DMH5_ARAVE|nr:hypothetical protein AVEN_238397-1 [Araneus ventricosus]
MALGAIFSVTQAHISHRVLVESGFEPGTLRSQSRNLTTRPPRSSSLTLVPEGCRFELHSTENPSCVQVGPDEPGILRCQSQWRRIGGGRRSPPHFLRKKLNFYFICQPSTAKV